MKFEETRAYTRVIMLSALLSLISPAETRREDMDREGDWLTYSFFFTRMERGLYFLTDRYLIFIIVIINLNRSNNKYYFCQTMIFELSLRNTKDIYLYTLTLNLFAI